MYFSALLLNLLECGLIVVRVSSTERPRTKNQCENQRRTYGSGLEETAEQNHQQPRQKRDEVAPQDNAFNAQDFYGPRYEAVMRILNSGNYPGYDFGQALGVRLQSRLVLTLCSAVTYAQQLFQRIDFWDHLTTHYPVNKCFHSDLTVHVMTVGDIRPIKPSKVEEVLIHPMCDNQYDVDLAVLRTEPIADSKNVWIHSGENLLFRRNLDRVVAAQAVLGKCSVPIYRIQQVEGKFVYKVDYAKVQFQHWSGCNDVVCPFWNPVGSKRKHQDPIRCKNQRNGTRYCMTWGIPDKGLCDLLAGTPVFCDIGNIQGVMGFMPKETYRCWPFNNKNAVMQGLNDGISWIAKTITMTKIKDYEENIPVWLKTFRSAFIDNITPRVKPKGKEKINVDITFHNFIGNQLHSVVNVYIGRTFLCRGVLVNPRLVIVPCSCITFDKYPDIKYKNIITPHELLLYNLDDNDIRVSLMVNGTQLSTRMVTSEAHKGCNSHYQHDTAWGELREPLPKHKVAWLMTNRQEEFARLMQITAIADGAMGHDCYYLEQVHDLVSPMKNKIRFVPWTRCIHNVCPDPLLRSNLQERCYAYDLDLSEITAYCIESENYLNPACDIKHGTPIFCNVEQARGLVGMVTTSMDVNPVSCFNRTYANRTGVVHVIHDFLPQFQIYTWIDDFIDEYLHTTAFAELVTPTSITFILVTIVAMIIF